MQYSGSSFCHESLCVGHTSLPLYNLPPIFVRRVSAAAEVVCAIQPDYSAQVTAWGPATFAGQTLKTSNSSIICQRHHQVPGCLLPCRRAPHACVHRRTSHHSVSLTSLPSDQIARALSELMRAETASSSAIRARPRRLCRSPGRLPTDAARII